MNLAVGFVSNVNTLITKALEAKSDLLLLQSSLLLFGMRFKKC